MASVTSRNIKTVVFYFYYKSNIYSKGEKRVILGEIGFKHEVDLFRNDIENYKNALYYPNEYFNEDIENISLSFDIWSLGVVFWEILTKKKLFQSHKDIINKDFLKKIKNASNKCKHEEFVLKYFFSILINILKLIET